MKLKGIIIAVVVLLIYGLGMYFVFGLNNSQSASSNKSNDGNIQNKDYYMVIGDSSILKYKNGIYVSSDKKTIESLPSMKVFVNNKYYGDYKLNFVSTWNLLNDKAEFVSYKGELLAISKDFDVVVRNINIREINDDDKYMLLSKYGINSFKYLTTNQAIDIDLDKNGEMDEIICLSSMEPSDSVSNYYNLVIIKYNNEIISVVDERKEDAKYVYDISSIINVLNNSNDSIIISKTEGYLAEFTNINYSIISYKNDNYVID